MRPSPRPARARLVDALAFRLLEAGKISNLHEDADVYTRLILLEQQFPEARWVPAACMYGWQV